MQQLSLQIFSQNKQIVKANCLEPVTFFVKKEETETTLMLGKSYQLSFCSEVDALACLVQSLNAQLQPFFKAIRNEDNLQKIKELYKIHLRVERGLQPTKSSVQNKKPSSVITKPSRLIDKDIAVPLVSVHDVDHVWNEAKQQSFSFNSNYDQPSHFMLSQLPATPSVRNI